MPFYEFKNFRLFLYLFAVLAICSCKPRGSSGSLSANEDESAPISEEEAHQFFSANVPLLFGQHDFFNEAEKNGTLRQQYNDLLSREQSLRELARIGTEYRKQYASALQQDFPKELYPFVLDPDGEVLRRLTLYMQVTESDWVEQSIPPQRAKMLALQDTKQRYSLPADWDEAKMLQHNYDAFLYFKRKTFTYELLDERQKKPSSPNVETWKRSVIRSIDQARSANLLKSAARTISEHSLPLQLRIENQAFQIDQQELAAAELVSGDQLAPNPRATFEGRRITFFDLGSRYVRDGAQKGFSFFWHLSLFRSKNTAREDFAQALYSIPDSFPASPGALVGIRIQGRVGDAELERLLENSNRTIVMNAQNLMEMIQAFRIPFSQEPKQRKESAYRYVVEAAEREAMLENIQTFLTRKDDQSFEALRSRLTERVKEKNQDKQNSYRSVSRLIQKDGLDAAPDDLVEGLRWWGYRDHPRYWQLRSSIAEASGAAKYDASPEIKSEHRSKIGLMRRFRLAYSNVFSQTPGLVRGSIGSVFLATYFFIGANTVPPVMRTIAGAVKSVVSHDSEMPASIDIDEDQVTNHSADSFAEKQKQPLFQITDARVPVADLPQYFSVMTEHQVAGEVKFVDKMPVNDPSADFKLVTVAPAGLEGHRIPVPSPMGYTLSSLSIVSHDGERKGLEFGEDFKILRSTDNIYSIEATTWLWKTRMTATFRKDPELMKRFGDRELKDSTALKHTNKELREAGFTKIADAMQKKIDAGPTTFADVAAIIGSESFYTYQPERTIYRYGRDNFFNELTKFEKDGCLFGQCTAGNELVYLYLFHYKFRAQDDWFALNRQVGFLRDPDALVLTAGNGHRFTRAYLSDGGLIHLDGTPQQMTEEDRARQAQLEQERKALDDEIRAGANGSGILDKLARIKASIAAKLEMWFGSSQSYDEPKLPNDNELQEIDQRVDWYFRREKTAPEMLEADPEFEERVRGFERSVKRQLQAGYMFKREMNNSEGLKALPAALRAQLPTASASKTLAILSDLRLGKLTYRQAIDGIHKQFPGAKVDESLPMRVQLSRLLDTIYERQAALFSGIQDKVIREGPSVKFAELANPKVSDPILELLGFLRASDWSPALSSFMRQNDGCVAILDKLEDGYGSGRINAARSSARK